MRTLSSGLRSAQRASSGSPEVYVKVKNTTYTSKLKGLKHIERPYGGIVVILLDNSDKSITADHRGNKVTLGYNFVGETRSDAAPLWVLTQTDVSREGELLTQLQCIDAWQKLSLLKVAAGGGVELKGTIVGTFGVGQAVTGQSSGAVGQVIAVGTGFIGVGKVANGPFTVGEVVQSDIYPTTQITVDTITDYGGGSEPAWSGDKTILEIITTLATDVATVVLDSSDGIVNVTKPYYTARFNMSYIEIIQDLMNYTKCAIRMEGDSKLHIFSISSAPGSADYSYNSTHNFFTDLRDTTLILPNRIVVVNAEQMLAGMTAYSGEAKDDAAIARFMEVVQPIFADVRSDAEATAMAESRLSRVQKEATRGTIEAPMNCGQELFDYIKVDDDRADISYYGWVGSITREWEEGMYKITIGLGGLSGAEGMPDDTEYPLPNIEQEPVPTVIPPYWIIPAAIQGYHHDIHFVADDWNTVSWESGTIKFYDGTTQAISAGSHNLTDGLVHYIYFDLDDDNPQVLKVVSNYINVLTVKTGMICLIQRASAEGIMATVIPSYGKEPLITCDVIDMTGILEYDYDEDLKIRVLLHTQISSGLLRLTADTIKNEKWYSQHGVVIDALHGINIFGEDNALTTRATEDGEIQCKVGADGAITAGAGGVILNASGIKILGGKFALADEGDNYEYAFYIDDDGWITLDAWWDELRALKITAHNRLKIPVGADRYD